MLTLNGFKWNCNILGKIGNFLKVQEIIGLNVDQLIVNRNENLLSLHTIRKSLSI